MVLVKSVTAINGIDGWLLIDFNNGNKKLVNMNPHMDGIAEKLKDPNFFKQVHVHPEYQTVTWPGEIDFAPDSLYDEGLDIQDLQKLLKITKDELV